MREALVKLLAQLIALLENMQKQERSRRDDLYDAAFASLGIDRTPNDEVPDEVACVHQLSTIIRDALPELRFPIMDSTKVLYGFLEGSLSWKPVDKPEKGDIILSVTGSGNGKIKNGHVGICGKNLSPDGTPWIMSNDSRNGLWLANYTLKAWKLNYERKGGMTTHFYRVF
jgi:hypothetical protein